MYYALFMAGIWELQASGIDSRGLYWEDVRGVEIREARSLGIDYRDLILENVGAGGRSISLPSKVRC